MESVPKGTDYLSAPGTTLALGIGMPRPNLIRTAEFPYHVHGRTNNKEWFRLSMQECWDIFEEQLFVVCRLYGAKIGSFVLMSNHFHMILWTPNENLGEIMNHLMREVSKKINRKSNRINHMFGGAYKWTLIQEQEYFEHVYRYVYQNPLVKKLVKRVEDYPYSTLNKILKNQPLKFQLFDQEIIDSSEISGDWVERLKWLNEPLNDQQLEVIQLGLRKRIFSFPLHKRFRKVVRTFRNLKL